MLLTLAATRSGVVRVTGGYVHKVIFKFSKSKKECLSKIHIKVATPRYAKKTLL